MHVNGSRTRSGYRVGVEPSVVSVVVAAGNLKVLTVDLCSNKPLIGCYRHLFLHVSLWKKPSGSQRKPVTDAVAVVPQFGQQGSCFLFPVVLIDPCLHLVYEPVLGLFVAVVYLLIRNNFYYNIPLTHKRLHMLLRNYANGNRRPKIARYLFKVNKDAGHTASYRPIGARDNWNIWSVFFIARWESFFHCFPDK